MCDYFVPCSSGTKMTGDLYMKTTALRALRTLEAECTQTEAPEGLCAASCALAAATIRDSGRPVTGEEVAGARECLVCSGSTYHCRTPKTKEVLAKAQACAACLPESISFARAFECSCGKEGSDATAAAALNPSVTLALSLLFFTALPIAGTLVFVYYATHHGVRAMSRIRPSAAPVPNPHLSLPIFA